MKKNILFYLSRYPGFGGIEQCTNILCNELINRNYNLYIVSQLQENEKELILLLDKKIEFKSLKEIKTLRSYIKEKKIDTIVYQDSFSNDFDLIEQETRGIKIHKIVVYHNTPDAFLQNLNYTINGKWTIKNRIRKFKTRIDFKYRSIKIIKWCDKLILLSEYYKPILKSILGSKYQESKIKIINNPLSIDLPIKPLQKTKNICLFIGRLQQQKGIQYLMNIWKEIENNKPDLEWQLIIVGDGPEKKYIEDFIKKNSLNKIQLEGFQTNVSNYYKEAQLFLMTSIFEGWPLTLFESMAYGCIPIVFNSFAAAKEIIENRQNGILIETSNQSEYIKQLQFLMEHEEIRKHMSVKAYQKASLFTINHLINSWTEIL